MAIDDKTKILKNGFEWEDEEKEFESVSEAIKFEDLKIGDYINANYSGSLIEIKDFSPMTITILPNYRELRNAYIVTLSLSKGGVE